MVVGLRQGKAFEAASNPILQTEILVTCEKSQFSSLVYGPSGVAPTKNGSSWVPDNDS